MADNLNAKTTANDDPASLKNFHAELMGVMRNMGLLDDLRKAGLTDDSDLRTKQEAGAGAVPKPGDNLAPNIKSVPQADR